MASERTITVVGLGPGRWEVLTVEAGDGVLGARVVVCRTLRHPRVDALRTRRPDLALVSFDTLYDAAPSFAELYPQMVEQLIAMAAEQPEGQPLVYAVPGHPLIAEESVRRLRQIAPAHGTAIQLVAGLSFLEPVCAALDIDPLERDLQLLDAPLFPHVDPA